MDKYYIIWEHPANRIQVEECKDLFEVEESRSEIKIERKNRDKPIPFIVVKGKIIRKSREDLLVL